MVKVIENKYIPFKGFKCLNFCGLIFKRKGTSAISERDLNHEAIHTAQMKELFYLPFYILYIGEWICKLIYHGDSHWAYRSISFEKEAFEMQDNMAYLRFRKPFAQWRKGFGL